MYENRDDVVFEIESLRSAAATDLFIAEKLIDGAEYMFAEADRLEKEIN